jgi:hypothetical protein
MTPLDTLLKTKTNIKITNPFEAICCSSTLKIHNFSLKTTSPFTLNTALNKPPFNIAAPNAGAPETNKKTAVPTRGTAVSKMNKPNAYPRNAHPKAALFGAESKVFQLARTQ